MWRHALVVLLIPVVPSALFCLLLAWPPDRGAPPRQLAYIEHSGDRFTVTQVWGSDFYTDTLEHVGADGTVTSRQMDGDDHKEWFCHIRVIEAERRLVITFPPDPRSWDYRWDLKRLTRTSSDIEL